MGTLSDELLQKILDTQKQSLAAQLAQIGLLQAIHAMITDEVATRHEHTVDMKTALKALEGASFQLATR